MITRFRTVALHGIGLLVLATPGGAGTEQPVVYWLDNDADNISRVNDDGTGAGVLVQTQAVPLGLALDRARRIQMLQ